MLSTRIDTKEVINLLPKTHTYGRAGGEEGGRIRVAKIFITREIRRQTGTSIEYHFLGKMYSIGILAWSTTPTVMVFFYLFAPLTTFNVASLRLHRRPFRNASASNVPCSRWTILYGDNFGLCYDAVREMAKKNGSLI